VLKDRFGSELWTLPVAADLDRPDIVAEFAFRLARLGRMSGLSVESLRSNDLLVSAAEKEAFELISRYEGSRPTEEASLSWAERSGGLDLCERYDALYAAFPIDSVIEFCPFFSGAGFLNSCEGDIGIADSLVEVKTTTHRPSGKDIRQLLVYLALDANAERRRWSHMGIFNPRRGTLHHAEIEPLVLRISGGRSSSEVFGELISFVDTNEIAIEKSF
jgi:hypothetical protein